MTGYPVQSATSGNNRYGLAAKRPLREGFFSEKVEGPKPRKSAISFCERDVNTRFVDAHLAIAIEALKELIDSGESVEQLRFESWPLSFDCEPIEISAGFGIESIDGFDPSGSGGLYFVDEPLDFIAFSFDNNLDSSIVKILDCSRDNKRLG